MKLEAWKIKRQQRSNLAFTDGKTRGQVMALIAWLEQELESIRVDCAHRLSELGRIANDRDRTEPYQLATRVMDLIERAGLHLHSFQTELGSLFVAIRELGELAAGSRIRGRVQGTPNA